MRQNEQKSTIEVVYMLSYLTWANSISNCVFEKYFHEFYGLLWSIFNFSLEMSFLILCYCMEKSSMDILLNFSFCVP